MAKQAVHDVLGTQRLPQQWVAAQVNHPHRQVVGGPPPGINQPQFLVRIHGKSGLLLPKRN